MPHNFALITPAGMDAVRELAKDITELNELKAFFEKVLEVGISRGFYRVIGEHLVVGKECRVRCIAETSSMPVNLSIAVMAWMKPERDDKRDEIRAAIEEIIREIHPIFSGANVFLNLVEKPAETEPEWPGDR